MNEQRPNLEGLRIFAIQHDRGESPIFVGRERETEHILLQAESIGAAHAAGRGTEGATIVISGCPGSGKSAFLKYFARAFSTLELTNTVLVPALCTHHALGARNEDELKAQLAKLAIENKGGGHKILQTLAAEVGKKLKVEETLKRLEEKITKDWGRRTVVCLLVDEIQNVTDENRVALELLHTRSLSPPVLPIYAGLDDSVEQLQRVGADLTPVGRSTHDDGAAARERRERSSRAAVRQLPGAQRRSHPPSVGAGHRGRGARLRAAPAQRAEERLRRAGRRRRHRAGRGHHTGERGHTHPKRALLRGEASTQRWQDMAKRYSTWWPERHARASPWWRTISQWTRRKRCRNTDRAQVGTTSTTDSR